MYVLLLLLLAGQAWGLFRTHSTSEVIKNNDELYQRAVFDSKENKGVFHQVFRQNEANRELIKATLRMCAK